MKNLTLNFITIPILVLLCSTVLADNDLNIKQSTPSPVSVQSAGSTVFDVSRYHFLKSGLEVKTIINSSGGTAKLGTLFSALFPEQSLMTERVVVLTASMSDDIDTIFKGSTFMFRGITRFPQELRINTGATPPASEFIPGVFDLGALSGQIEPSSLSVFVAFEQGGMNEEGFIIFDKLKSLYNSKENKLTFDIPGAAFTDKLSNKGYEAVIVLAINSSANGLK